jgi:hypothetical protein
MSKRQIIYWAVLLLVAAIQFIRPARNNSQEVAGAAFIKQYSVPDSLNRILTASCFDCHSNHTRYPWYSHVQPFGWMLARHIKHGRAELNFSEFSSYSKRRQISKLKAIASQVEDNEMPLSSYKWLHKKARLSENEKAMLITWMRATADSISSLNP